MACYFITGALGAGKTLCAVGKAVDALEGGRRIATNLDLYPEHMGLGDRSRCSITRLPDKPRLADLEILGYGCPEKVEDESKYGLLILDEMGTWLNSRAWRDAERAVLLDWFRHARKWHWHVFFIVQDVDSLDGQIIGLAEFKVSCWRMDRLPIPGVSSLLRIGGIDRIFPKIHVANVRMGVVGSGVAVERWFYRGVNLYAAYDTRQKFSDQRELLNGELVDMRATYTLLPPYYIKSVALQDHYQKLLDGLRGHSTPVFNLESSSWGPFIRRYAPTAAFALVLLLASLLGFSRKPSSASAPPAPVQAAPASDSSSLASSLLPSPSPGADKKSQEKIPNDDSPKRANYIWEMIRYADLKLLGYVYTNDWQLISLRIEATRDGISRVISRDELLMYGIKIILSSSGVELLKDDEKVVVVKG